MEHRWMVIWSFWLSTDNITRQYCWLTCRRWCGSWGPRCLCWGCPPAGRRAVTVHQSYWPPPGHTDQGSPTHRQFWAGENAGVTWKYINIQYSFFMFSFTLLPCRRLILFFLTGRSRASQNHNNIHSLFFIGHYIDNYLIQGNFQQSLWTSNYSICLLDLFIVVFLFVCFLII